MPSLVALDSPRATRAVERHPAVAVTRSQDRVVALDVLRCVAVLLVFGAHPAFKWPEGSEPVLLARLWFQVGRSGVDLFFVLSGFLVAGLLFADAKAHGRIHLRSFYVRRGLKIWPAYYFYVAYLALLFAKFDAPWSEFLPFLLHVQNYVAGTEVYAPHLWSLSLEEHFYLVLPLVLAATRRYWSLEGFALGTLGVLLLGAAFREIPEPGVTHLRLDGLTIGVCLAYLYHFHEPWFWWLARPWLLPAGALLVLYAFTTLSTSTAFMLPAVYVGYAGVVLGALALGRARSGGRLTQLAAGVGRYSYSIYLWHIDFGFRFTSAVVMSGALMTGVLWLDWAVHTLIYTGVACVGGVMAGRCVEFPVLALRERWCPSRARALNG